MLYHGLLFGVLMALFVGLLLACYIQKLYRALEPGIGDFRVNIRRADLFVTESMLGESQITGLLVDSSCEGMTERMHRISAADPSFFKPVHEAELHLTGSNPSFSVGEKKRIARFCRVALEIGFQKSFKAGTEEDDLLDLVFPINPECPLAKVNVVSIEGNQGAQSNAGSQEKREHEGVALRDQSLGGFKGSKQCMNLTVGYDRWWSSRVSGHPNQAGGILFQIPAIDKESEKGTQDGFRSVERYHRFRISVLGSSEGF